MQTKKDDVKDKLIEAGLNNFLVSGFEGASIRKISKDAGTTLGNFYNYFDTKLALFDEIVKHEYHTFIDFIQKHNDSEEPVSMDSIDSASLYEMLKHFSEHILPSFTDKFLLLLAKSTGTPYEGARAKFEDLIRSHYLEHLKTHQTIKYDEIFANLLSHQFIDSMIYILKQKISEKEKKRLMAKMFLFMFLGLASIMEKFPGE